MNFSQRLIHGLSMLKIVPSCSLSFYDISNPCKVLVIVSSNSCSHRQRLLGLINRVKSSSRLQRLKQSYLLTYNQKVSTDRTTTILGLLFRKTIHLPLTARTIRTCIFFVRVYVRSYACYSPLLYLWTVLVRACDLIPS